MGGKEEADVPSPKKAQEGEEKEGKRGYESSMFLFFFVKKLYHFLEGRTATRRQENGCFAVETEHFSGQICVKSGRANGGGKLPGLAIEYLIFRIFY